MLKTVTVKKLNTVNTLAIWTTVAHSNVTAAVKEPRKNTYHYGKFFTVFYSFTVAVTLLCATVVQIASVFTAITAVMLKYS